jgi:uncharacterized protein (DUF362 family)
MLLAQLALGAQVVSKAQPSRLAMPGPYRGRVAVASQPTPIPEMIRQGMMRLTGAPDWQSAWKVFFQPGDVVGIKLNPVGRPYVISSPEVFQEIVAGLQAAGVKARDIVAYDRYRLEFLDAGFDKWLPPGVRWTHAAEKWEAVQQDMQGYDPDHFIEMALTLPGSENRRSYAARFITKDVNKLINLPVLKDHQSAGVTLALKNLSHGLVNNVNRTHSTSSLNACGMFIPTVVSMPVIRNKAVLHILDGIQAQYHGGPGGKKQFVWNHGKIYFATDPVALDRIGWKEIDRKRVAMGMKTIASDYPDSFSTFVRRQPEHIEIAGALGLGEWDDKRIQLIG